MRPQMLGRFLQKNYPTSTLLTDLEMKYPVEFNGCRFSDITIPPAEAKLSQDSAN